MHNENFASPVLTISTVLHNKVPWWLGPTMQIVRIHPDQLCLLSVDPSDSIAQSFSALPGLYLLRLFWGHIRFIWKDFQ